MGLGLDLCMQTDSYQPQEALLAFGKDILPP